MRKFRIEYYSEDFKKWMSCDEYEYHEKEVEGFLDWMRSKFPKYQWRKRALNEECVLYGIATVSKGVVVVGFYESAGDTYKQARAFAKQAFPHEKATFYKLVQCPDAWIE